MAVSLRGRAVVSCTLRTRQAADVAEAVSHNPLANGSTPPKRIISENRVLNEKNVMALALRSQGKAWATRGVFSVA